MSIAQQTKRNKNNTGGAPTPATPPSIWGPTWAEVQASNPALRSQQGRRHIGSKPVSWVSHRGGLQ